MSTEFETDTGCEVSVRPQVDFATGQPTGNTLLVLRMVDPEDVRWAELLLTPSEVEQLGTMLLKPSGPYFPPSEQWNVGDRFIVPGYSGSYPDKSRDRYGTIKGFTRKARWHEHLVVRLDDEDSDHPSFNPDIIRHLREGEGS